MDYHRKNLMNKLKNILKSPFLYVLLFTLVVISITIDLNTGKDLRFSDILALLLTAVGILVSLKKAEVQDIASFKALHNAMTKEMKKILDDKSDENKHLHILSFTPAFGNISTPELYETNDKKKSKMTYKYLLEKIIEDEVDVKIVCYNKNKRLEYHKDWANIIAKEDRKKQDDYIKKWERQAKDIIAIVRNKKGFDSVMEVNHLHPILFFSSDDILIQYMIRKDSEKGSSDVSGTILNQKNKINFFKKSFEEYYHPSKVIQLYENYFRNEPEYIDAAEKVKRELDGYAANKGLEINDIDILLAYGGGKDSTMVLTFLKYVQDLFLKNSKSTFMLHIIVHVHPGMRESVLRNIHNVLLKLELNKDSNVKITFKSKNSSIDVKQFLNDSFDSGKVSISENIKNEFKRELLLLGHLSKGLGRHTFCYTCNIDMIMSIINYTLEFDQSRKIDLIVTGDSKKEQYMYTKWLNPIFNFISNNKNSEVIGLGNYKTELFFRDFTNLRNTFNNYLGNENQKINEYRNVESFPKIFNIHNHIKFSISTSFKGLLQDELGFLFNEDSFNFSETDCFYPAIMAHLAALKGGKNYAKNLQLHIEHVSEIMREKGFPTDLIEHGKKSYEPYSKYINSYKYKNIEKFLIDNFGIDSRKMEALIYSPFLDNGKGLQSFLEQHEINDLDGTTIINYIKIKEGTTYSKDEIVKIEEFIREWIGLDRKDIERIMNCPEKPNDLLEIIAKNDPYVKNVVIDNETIVVSGR